MAQQTAVEWLEKQLLSHTKIENSKYIQQNVLDIALWQFNKYLEQAKQMEKEQIIKAWDDGDYAYFYSKETGRDFDNGEEYYNETYKQDENNTI